MEDQVPSSTPPSGNAPRAFTEITPEMLATMKAQARELAIQQIMAQPRETPPVPKVVYVRRNLTVAELILIFVVSCGLVTGLQAAWNFASNTLPRLEIKLK